MPKNKMIAKGCPKCEQQVPVACKACPCGHLFFSARRAAKVLSSEVDIRRRTQRVRREKPNYYDSLEYEKQVRKTKTRSSESANDDDLNKKDNNNKSKRKKMKKEEDEDDEVINNLSTSKQNQCTIILDELNRKLQLVTWNPT